MGGDGRHATDLAFGAVGLAVILFVDWIYGRAGTAAGRRGPWVVEATVALVVLALVPVLGWIVLAALPGVERRRKARAALQAVFVFTGLVVFGFLSDAGTKEDT